MPFATSVAFFFCLFLLNQDRAANAQAIGSIYTSYGPLVVTQDSSGGQFLYNIWSSNGFGPMRSVAANATPKNGTALGLAGWGDPGKSIYASIFYQTTNNTLSQLLIKCSDGSGMCVNYGETLMSSNVAIPVSPNTKIAASLYATAIGNALPTILGYRVTYEDIYGSLRQLSYANNTGNVTNWADGSLISNLSSTAGSPLATYFTIGSNVTAKSETVFQVYDSQIVPLVATVNNITNSIHDNETWSATAPINSANLPDWNSTNGSFASILYRNWNCIFYIDTTRTLQWVRSVDGGQTWSHQPGQDVSLWPLADQPSAPIAAATSQNASTSNNTADLTASIFYTSGQKLVQVTMTNYEWMPYSIVEASVVIPSNTTLNATATLHLNSNSEKVQKIKIGAATGGSIVFLLIITIVGWCIYRKKSQLKNSSNSDSTANLNRPASNNFGYGGKPELDGKAFTLSELDHDPECKLLHQLALIRQYELRAGIPTELENSERPRPELEGLCRCEMDASVAYELESPISEMDGGIFGALTVSEERKPRESEGEGEKIEKGKEVAVSVAWDILRRQEMELEGKEGKRFDESKEDASEEKVEK